MSDARHLHGVARHGVPAYGPVGTRPTRPHGVAVVGRITKLLIGQGYGFIRLANDREIYFHRADAHEGTSINDLCVGDAVTFELLDDRISGPRALQVKRRGRVPLTARIGSRS